MESLARILINGIEYYPSEVQKIPMVIGGSVNRKLDGSATRDIIKIKNRFKIVWDVVDYDEYQSLYTIFASGQPFAFQDDLGDNYTCVWAGDTFGLDSRLDGITVLYTGNTVFEEV